MKWNVEISESAYAQFHEHAAYYESKNIGLGDRFLDTLLVHVDILERIPFAQVRYENVRCLPIAGFPFMFHFGINEEQKLVTVHALIHTSRDPESNWGGDDWHVSEPVYYYGQVAV